MAMPCWHGGAPTTGWASVSSSTQAGATWLFSSTAPVAYDVFTSSNKLVVRCHLLYVTTLVTKLLCALQMRAGNLELGDPFRDLRESIKIFFVCAVKEDTHIHQVRGEAAGSWQQLDQHADCDVAAA